LPRIALAHLRSGTCPYLRRRHDRLPSSSWSHLVEVGGGLTRDPGGLSALVSPDLCDPLSYPDVSCLHGSPKHHSTSESVADDGDDAHCDTRGPPADVARERPTDQDHDAEGQADAERGDPGVEPARCLEVTRGPGTDQRSERPGHREVHGGTDHGGPYWPRHDRVAELPYRVGDVDGHGESSGRDDRAEKREEPVRIQPEPVSLRVDEPLDALEIHGAAFLSHGAHALAVGELARPQDEAVTARRPARSCRDCGRGSGSRTRRPPWPARLRAVHCLRARSGPHAGATGSRCDPRRTTHPPGVPRPRRRAR